MKRSFFLIMLMTVALAGCSASKKQKPDFLTKEEVGKLAQLLDSTAPPADINVNELPVLTPDALTLAFAENSANAQSVYGKKWIKVRGRLAAEPIRTESEVSVKHVLTLEHNSKQISCFFFSRAEQARLARLKKGQTLVLVGRCSFDASGPSLIFCAVPEDETPQPAQNTMKLSQ